MSHEVTPESVKVVKFKVINQFWIVRFHCYSSPSIIRTSIIQSKTVDYLFRGHILLWISITI